MASAKNNQPTVGQDEGLDPTEVILFPAMKPHYDPSKQSSTMGGNFIHEDSEFASPNGVRTLLLLGRRGTGKSETGNTILGDKKFKSMFVFEGVTSTCELQSTVLENGRTLNVIDTPGLKGSTAEPDFICKDIARCIDMPKDGIHAILLVLSATSRFTMKELAAIKSLESFFGHRIYDYTVVVFTNGDEVEENGDTLDDVFSRGVPKPMREMLDKCGNRKVLFDNKSKDKVKRAEQLNELLFLVDEVVKINGGKPFADELFAAELKTREEKPRDQSIIVDYYTQWANAWDEEFIQCFKEEMIKLYKMVGEKLKETIFTLGLHVTEEREAQFRSAPLRNLDCDYLIFSAGIISKCYRTGSKEKRGVP